MSDHFLSHSNSFGFEMEKDAAGCRAFNRNYIVGGNDMQISPSLPQVKAIAAQGQYRALPVHCEILSDFLTPIEALRILKNVSTHCYLLESALADEK